MQENTIYLLDVRNDMEWEDKHIPDAHRMYVGHLQANLPPMARDCKVVVHCSGGHRAGLAVSIRRRQGFTNVPNMLGGLTAWETLGLPLQRGR